MLVRGARGPAATQGSKARHQTCLRTIFNLMKNRGRLGGVVRAAEWDVLNAWGDCGGGQFQANGWRCWRRPTGPSGLSRAAGRGGAIGGIAGGSPSGLSRTGGGVQRLQPCSQAGRCAGGLAGGPPGPERNSSCSRRALASRPQVRCPPPRMRCCKQHHYIRSLPHPKCDCPAAAAFRCLSRSASLHPHVNSISYLLPPLERQPASQPEVIGRGGVVPPNATIKALSGPGMPWARTWLGPFSPAAPTYPWKMQALPPTRQSTTSL